MALINGIYVHVTDESITKGVEVSSHSVEGDADITDHMKPKAVEVSLSGKIVNYTANIDTSTANVKEKTITAWVSLVKKCTKDDLQKALADPESDEMLALAFDTMSFDYLNNEILAFYGGTDYVNTAEIQYYDLYGTLIDCSTEPYEKGISCVKFELKMPYGATVRIQKAKKDYCCFNIINKSTTGYGVRDYDADAESVNDYVLSNTYNGETGRIRTEFTNYDYEVVNPPSSEERTAPWVLEKLTEFARCGTLVKYEGRNLLENYQITEISTSHPNTIAGGAEFDMTLKEFRGATNSYVEVAGSGTAEGGTQQISEGDNSAVYYEVQVGDNIYTILSEYCDLKKDADGASGYITLDWLIETNPNAFDDTNDATTLKACETILVGYR